MEKTLKNFEVTIYGQLTPFSQTTSLARCRIFYKYGNRNSTYITDEFAEKLIKTLPYTPIKGIYDTFDEDYTDHGAKRSLGRIYGIVPENPNFSWEKHLDNDGIEREYACCDVLIFSALYEESDQIVGKAQSMELYEPSIKGEWTFIDGKKYYKFDEGCFLGLQILGNEVEPCFEGAAFFELYDNLKETVEKLEKYCLNFEKIGGTSDMEKLNFKLSDSQKHDILWSLLNTEYNEECGWIVTYGICDIYDEYALVYNYEEGYHERVYYTKNDEDESITINEKKKCYVIDVTEDEKVALDALRAFNGNTYEKVDEKFSTITTLEEKNSEFSIKIAELNDSIATLTMERDEAKANLDSVNADLVTANESLSSLNEKAQELESFKLSVEMQEKKNIVDSYCELLSEEVLSVYTDEKLAEYTAVELDKELAYELKNTNLKVFTKAPQYVPKDLPKTGIEAILDKYKK